MFNAIFRKRVQCILTFVIVLICVGCKPTEQTPYLLAEWTIGNVHDIAWSPDSSMFAVNYWVDGDNANSFVQAFDIKTLSSKWVAANSLAMDLAFTPDGKYLVETNTFAPFFYWRSVEDGNVVRQIVIEDLSQIKSGDCNGGGQIMLVNQYKNTVLVADVNDLLGPRSNNYVGIRQWNLETGQCEQILGYRGASRGAFDLFDLNSAGSLLVYGGVGPDGEVVVWDVEKQTEVCRTSQAEFGRFIPGKNTLVIVREQGMVFVDAATCHEIREWHIAPSPQYENYLAFSPNGDSLALARDEIQILDIATGETLAQIPYPEDAVLIDLGFFWHGIRYSPNGHYLLIAYYLPDSVDDGKIQLWQIK